MNPQLEEVVKFALYQCRARNNPITEMLASFVAQTILNKRKNRFYLEERLNESELNELKNETLNKLSNRNSPDLKTIQLQIQYESALVENTMQSQMRVKKQSDETGKLIDDVVTLEIKNAKDFEGLTNLYRKIFNFLLFKNKQLIESGNKVDIATHFNIEKEVAAALESVIPRAALGPFVSLNPSEKVTQLVELSNLVIGIRLFNKKIGKGGASLSSLEDITQYSARSLLEEVRKESDETGDLGAIYTNFFLNLDMFGITETEVFKDELVFLRQYLSYLIQLEELAEQTENIIESNRARFTKEIEDLKKLLENKQSAPKEQVYPKFAVLAQAHIALFEEKQIACERVLLFQVLQEMRGMIKLSLPYHIQKQCRAMNLQMQFDPSQINYQPESGVQRLLPSNTPDFLQIDIDFLGFCIWTIVKHNGLLINGNHQLGIYRYKEKNMLFTTEKAVNEFIAEPQKFMVEFMNVCRQRPHLIRLFKMEDQFKNLKYLDDTGAGLSNKLMVDKELQTPVHFIEKNLDPNYCWNEWELRRKAIQMANIRKRQTKAQQTILSNFKVDSEAQVYELKDKSTSTGQNQGLNPLRPRNYIVGLRDKQYHQQQQ